MCLFATILSVGKLISPKKVTSEGRLTKSAHPGMQALISLSCSDSCSGHNSSARFSPDDKFSRHRVTIKKRYGVLLTQQPAKPL